MTAATSITVRVPLKIRRRPGGKMVVTPVRDAPDTAIPTRTDPVLVKAIARAIRYQRMLDDGHYSSISEMAEAERIDRGYLGRILRLALLAPDIVEDIIDGRPPGNAGLSALMGAYPIEWALQRSAIISATADAADGATAGAPP